MNLIKINDIKILMGQLLAGDMFDRFFLDEAEAVTYAKLTLNGRRNINWYKGETDISYTAKTDIYDKDMNDKDMDISGVSELIRWKEAKHIFFEFIKGKKTPDLFKVSLKADEEMAYNILKESGFYDMYLKVKLELHMQLRYENNELNVVTGIYNREFTLDKSLENAWDKAVMEWLRRFKIMCEN